MSIRNEILIKTGLDYIKTFYGKPYIWGGDDAIEGFDCSGLVIEFLKACGIVDENFDATAQELSRKYIEVSNPKPGTLVFFGRPENITHVGICLNHLQFIEAGGGGRNTTNSEIASEQNAVIRLRLIANRKSWVGFVDPFHIKP